MMKMMMISITYWHNVDKLAVAMLLLAVVSIVWFSVAARKGKE